MGSIIPPGGIPPPAIVPGPPPTGPIDEIPAVIPGGSGGASPPTTIDSSTQGLPPPPVLEPYPGLGLGQTSPDSVRLLIWRWDQTQNNWTFIPWFVQGWKSFPVGWYISARQDLDGNVDYGPHTNVFVVDDRVDENGVAQPLVIPDPTAPTSPDARCPPNSGWADFLDGYSDQNEPMCSYVAPPPPPTCPPGYHWDVATESCIADVVIPPPPPPILGGPPPPPPPPPVSQPDTEGDEITNTLCAQMAANAAAIVAAINALNSAPPGAATDDCCKAVVTAIAGVSTSIGLIFNLLASKGFVFSPVNNFAPAITIDVPPGPPPVVNVDVPPFDQANLERIAKATETSALQGDVPQAVLNQLFESGVIPKSMSNLLQGSPWSEVLAAIEAWKGKVTHATWWQDVSYGLRWLAKINAGDPGGAPTPSLDDPPLGGADASTALAAGTKEFLEWGFDHFDTIASPFVKGILDAHAGEMRAMRDVQPGDEISTATKLMTEASTFGIGAHFAAVLGEMIYPSKTLGFPQLAATLALFSGYDELIKGYIGSEVRAVITAPHTYATNARARSYLPNAREALTLSARRKLLDADLNALLDFNGISPTYRAAEELGKYRPISPRALATLTLDQPFDRAQMQEILEDNSMSPDHVQFMLTQLEYNSTKNVRAQYIAEAESAYKAGVVGDQEMSQILGDAGWSAAAIQFVKSKILLQRRVTLANQIEKQVTPLVVNGNITPDQGLQELEAAGVQDWYAQLVIGLASTRADIAAAKLEAREERQLEIARQRNLTRAAVAEFQRGVVDTTGLAAALAAIGLDPTLVASVVAVQDATRTGRMRLLYGQLLSQEDAKILSDRVAAIEGQFKKQLLSLDQTRAQLDSLNVNAPERDALLARWAAALAATGKYAYLVNPLTGQKGG